MANHPVAAMGRDVRGAESAMKVLSRRSAPWLMLVMLLSLPLARSFGADALSLINGRFDAKSKPDRQQIARDLLQKIEQLDSFLPRIKPSEAQWLVQERAAIDRLKDSDAKWSRLRNYMGSSELQQQKLKSLLDSIKESLSCTVQEHIEAKAEMLCWLLLSFHLSDHATIDDAMIVLIRNGRLPSDVAQKVGLGADERFGYGTAYEWYARGVQEFIVIPYFTGKLE